eukprot:CAMPEP_0185731706 /NCGR_PEP_ID=MMETSP1171-20130828/13788_1 /TAXON_ID=374046 /ORGANISM="Helicotheca tamensis, Strain CCMP826" /LENGTH=122 /DNA_ID=CAMNT_0028401021 /DNA_START=143 /DNA_END=511 /DNA_ORIENTATION=-
MSDAVKGDEGKSLQRKFKGSVIFTISTTNESYVLDLKKKSDDGNFTVSKLEKNDSSKPPKVDLYVTVSEDDMMKLVNKKLNPQQAFMGGKLKIKGKMALAMKLNAVLAATRKHMAPPTQSKL